MWWHGPFWGPWWIMPILGILFMVVMVFIMSRFLSGRGGFCGGHTMNHSNEEEGVTELKREIRALREEIRALKGKDA